MSITVIDHPTYSPTDPQLPAEFTGHGGLSQPEATAAEYDTDPIFVAVQRQAAPASAAARRVTSGECDAVDPQAWLFAERSRYREQGTCDPYAMLMLMTAGLLPVR